MLKLKTVFVDLKKWSAVVSKEIVKKTVHSKVNMKVNNLKCKIPDVATLIPTNHYITDKQNFEGIKEMLVKKYLMLVV